MKENIIKKLTNLPFIINNTYLKQYIWLVSAKNTQAGYQELHHIICKSFSKTLNEPVDNSADNLVSLLFKDHCKAHWLLYKCTTGEVKVAMANAFVSMIAFKNLSKDTLLTFGLTEADYSELQLKIEKLRQDKALNYWKAEDDEFLIKNYANNGQRYCAEHLGRSLKAVSSRASDLGLVMNKWWTDELDNFLKANYHKLGPKECSKQLNRSYGSVVSEAGRIGLTKQNFYSNDDINFIKENYAKYGENYCAEKLKRTSAAILRYAHILGLRKLPQGTPIYCPELDRTFSSIKDASIALNLSDGNICAVVNGKIEKTKGLHFYKINKEQYYEERKNKN